MAYYKTKAAYKKEAIERKRTAFFRDRHKKVCTGCNKEMYIFAKGKCKFCVTKETKPLTKSAIQKIKKKRAVERTKQMHEWFLEVWEKRKKFDPVVRGSYVECFESGKKLYSKYFKFNTCCYSHYLPKAKYRDYAFEEWNIEIVDPAIHDQWEIDKEKCPKMFNRLKEIENGLQNDGTPNVNM